MIPGLCRKAGCAFTQCLCRTFQSCAAPCGLSFLESDWTR
uniref:Uncharacterized protein n=1 Tax=Anguilla anguilla TaxID=7936 RepID=A0A0E9QP25_ANGAN